MDDLSYSTIDRPGEGTYRDRGSKFIAYARSFEDSDDLGSILSEIKSVHPKARHFCYAYRIGNTGDQFRYNDDGEPSGSAGRPIYNELLSREITDTICIVVRYFGGTKLGVPGLIAAYRGASIEALDQAGSIKIQPSCVFSIEYNIEDMGKLYSLLKSRSLEIVESIYEPSPKLNIKVPLYQADVVSKMIIADFYGYDLDDINDNFESDRLKISRV